MAYVHVQMSMIKQPFSTSSISNVWGRGRRISMLTLGFIQLYFIDQAHDKLEEGRKQVETQDTVQLSREVSFSLCRENIFSCNVFTMYMPKIRFR